MRSSQEVIGYQSNRAAEEDMGTALSVDIVFQTRTPGYFERNMDRDFETFQPVLKAHWQSNKEKTVGPRKHRNSSASKTQRLNQNQFHQQDHKHKTTSNQKETTLI